MIKTNKLFRIVSSVVVFAAIAFSLPAQAGFITRTQSPFRKAFSLPAPVLKCPLGYKVVAPENSVSPAWLTPNQKLYVEQWEGRTLYHLGAGECRTPNAAQTEPESMPTEPMLVNYNMSTSGNFSIQTYQCESFVTVKGGYACRLDDLSTDDVCPAGSYLHRAIPGVYQCTVPSGSSDLLDGASCLPGFHEEDGGLNFLTCVLDGTTLQEEGEKFQQGKFCLDPNSRRVFGPHPIFSWEIGCAYLSERFSVDPNCRMIGTIKECFTWDGSYCTESGSPVACPTR